MSMRLRDEVNRELLKQDPNGKQFPKIRTSMHLKKSDQNQNGYKIDLFYTFSIALKRSTGADI